MIRESSQRSLRPFGLMLILLAQAATVAAQIPDKLPPEPAYLGEIRRSPDGQLKTVAADAKLAAAAVKPATMVVGPGEKITTITEAARLAQDGEVIEIRPGNYYGQPAIWAKNEIIIRGVGARPVMLADGKSAEGKAIWVVRGGKVTIQNIEFRGARVASFNGAGIRFEKGELTVQSCAFFDNEMGILTANLPELSLEVIDSEFGDAPRHPGDLHHLLYVGGIGKFVLRGSRFHNGYLGHLVKSRARENHILYNMLVDGAGGRASYELEFPNGGLAYVIGNAIGQSAGTDNPSIVAYGAEGRRWPDNALVMAHNTLVNDHHSGKFLNVFSDKIGADAEVWLLNNLMVGNGDLNKPAQGRFDGNRLVARGDLIEFGGVPLRLTNMSPLRGAVRPPGQARGVELMPGAEFRFPVGSRPMRPNSMLAPGAFQ
ncbi:MAG: hypothetical protein CVU31_14580 [Betaproteobacteria bacterium HGW-Betaproteobacteria-4]|jgi:hypothetical protein|nr:MAG: hypothetical protein CVU31_14580 [Betaproteobacteria bacterium HGW-Betaproteobacteria-4]